MLRLGLLLALLPLPALAENFDCAIVQTCYADGTCETPGFGAGFTISAIGPAWEFASSEMVVRAQKVPGGAEEETAYILRPEEGGIGLLSFDRDGPGYLTFHGQPDGAAGAVTHTIECYGDGG